jgi:hypothetical protein
VRWREFGHRSEGSIRAFELGEPSLDDCEDLLDQFSSARQGEGLVGWQ